MNSKEEYVPENYQTLNMVASYKDTERAIEFYKKAFNAVELSRFPNPKGKGIMHAELKIGESAIMMGDESPERKCFSAESLKGSPISFYLYTKDADALFDQAIKAGGRSAMPMADMFWGDRCGTVVDPFGYSWTIATHVENLSHEEIRKRGEQFLAAMPLV